MENIKKIEAPLKYNYDTPENREMLKTKISDMFSQFSLFQTYEHKTQYFWNAVEEIKETMYIIVKNIEILKSDLSKSNNIRIDNDKNKKIDKDIDKDNRNYNHDNIIQQYNLENVIKSHINISKNEKINLLDKIKMQPTPRDEKVKTAHKIFTENLQSKYNSNSNRINRSVEIPLKKTQRKEKEIIPVKEIYLQKGERHKSIPKDVKSIISSGKEINKKVDKKEKKNLSYNSNNTNIGIRNSLNSNPKSSIETKRLTLPLNKEKILKKSTVSSDKKNHKFQSIEINLNLDQEPIKILPSASEEIIRENLQKNENKDISLPLENLNNTTDHHLDTKENQTEEITIDDYITQKDIEQINIDMVETSF